MSSSVTELTMKCNETTAYLTVLTVMSWFAINSPVPLHFLVELLGTLQRRLAGIETLTEKRPQQRHEPLIRHHPTVPCQVPRQLDHRNNGTETMLLVEVMSVDGDFVLQPCQRPDVPCHVIAPTLNQFTDCN